MNLSFVWAPSARADLRRLDRETAMRVLLALTRYAETGEGDVKALEGRFTGTHQLRVGDWRMRFKRAQGGVIHRSLLKIADRLTKHEEDFIATRDGGDDGGLKPGFRMRSILGSSGPAATL